MALKVTDTRNFVAGLLYMAFGAATAIGSLNYSLGTPRSMGAGFFPFVVSLALVFTGLVVALSAIHRDAPVTGLGRWEMRPILTVCFAVAVFGLLLKPAGLAISLLVLIGISMFAAPERSLKTYLLAVAILLPMAWLLFIALLGLPIPILPRFLGN